MKSCHVPLMCNTLLEGSSEFGQQVSMWGGWDRSVGVRFEMDDSSTFFFFLLLFLPVGRLFLLEKTHTSAVTLQFNFKLSRGQRPTLKLMLVGHAAAKESRKNKTHANRKWAFSQANQKLPVASRMIFLRRHAASDLSPFSCCSCPSCHYIRSVVLISSFVFPGRLNPQQRPLVDLSLSRQLTWRPNSQGQR